MKASLLIVFTLAAVFAASAQSITVMRNGASSRQEVKRLGGNVYISTMDFARLTGAHSIGKYDSLLTYSAGSAAFAIGTPFVWTTRTGNQKKLVQLPLVPVLSNGTMYVPLWGAVSIVQSLVSQPLRYDPALEVLTVGASRPPTAVPPATVAKVPKPHRDSIRSILVEARSNGVLITIDYASAPSFKPTIVLGAGNRVTIGLGTARYDSSNAKFYAGANVEDQYFVITGDTFSLRLTVIDSVQSSNRKINGNVASFTLRTSRRTAPVVVDPKKDRWKMDIVVLDAGHGGQDPGAQGLGGTNEKDATLGIVLKLGKILEKAGLKVVYTRTTDVFVELYRRAQIANEARGKLFISIHCNSMPTKPNPANGFESYILRPGKNETAVRVAARENNSIKLEEDRSRYQGATEEAFIVAAMAQSGFVKYSEKFATQVQNEVGKQFPASKNNGVSQAGFLVLVGASMPNILIETGYISNTREEKVLASKSGQQHFAEGIASAVKKYKTIYEHAMGR